MKRFTMQLLSVLLCMVLLLSGSQARAGAQSPTDPGKILTEAYALEDGMSLEYVATLTGVITQIKTPYDSHYRNISVTIQVPGYEQMPIVCYRMKGENADAIGVEDTITVTGTLTNYRGTIEFRQGCTLDSWVDYVVDWYVPTDADIVDAAYKLEPGTSLPYIASLTGRIVSVDTLWDDIYENITVTMVVEGRENKPILCFRLRGDGARNLRVGDQITVVGTLANYNGTIEFQQGCRLEGGEPEEPTETLIVAGTATFQSWEEACEGFGAQFIPAEDGTVTVNITDCDPAFCLDIFANGDWLDQYFGTGPEQFIIDVYQGVTYDFVLYTVAQDEWYFDYVPGSVSFDITADVAAGEPAPEEPESWPSSMAIVGSSLPGISDWDPADPAGDMTLVAEAVYYKQLQFDGACYAKFKFVGNDSWDDEWNFGGSVPVEFGNTVPLERGPGSQDIGMEIPRACTVDLYLDLTNGAEYPLLFVGVEYPMTRTRDLYVQVPDSWNQVYAYTWDGAGNTFLGDWPGTRLDKADQWYVGQIPYDGTGMVLSNGMEMTDDLYLEGGADVWITVSRETDEVGKNLSTIHYTDPSEPTDGVYRVTGNADWLGNWNPAFEGGRMEQTAPGVYTKTFENVPAGEYEFKITKNGVWDGAVGDAYGCNYCVKLTKQTDLTIILTIEDGFGKVTVSYDTLTPGDINGDSKLNVADVSKLYAHIRGTVTLTDPDVLALADLSGDGKLNVADVSKLYAYVRGVSAEALVDKAYALEEGESLPGSVTLTGTVTDILLPYQPNAHGITLVMVVAGREDKPIICTRLMGQDAANVALEDKITVTGTLQKYYGTVEFAEGCSLDQWVHTLTQEELQLAAVDAAYALKENTSMDQPVTLTGKVISVDQPYSETLPYISITIAVPGREDKPVGCYRLTGEEIHWVLEGSTVTVFGTLRNYYGTVEFAPGCQLQSVAPIWPTVETDQQKIVDLAYSLAEGEKLNYDVKLEGRIIAINDVYSSEYQNITVTIAVSGRETMPIRCYRLRGEYVDRLAVGDTIEVTGQLENYYGCIEFTAGCLLTDWIYAR